MLDGKFVADTIRAEYGEEFTFAKDGHFERYTEDDIEQTLGAGDYILKDEVLTLKFSNVPDSLVKTYFDTVNILKSYSSNSDSIIYDCHIEDMKDADPLQGALVGLRGIERYTISNDSGITYKFEADNNGNVSLKFPKRYIPLLINIYYAGYDKISLLVSDSLSRVIQFKMRDAFHLKYVKKGEVVSYKIRLLNESAFYIEIPVTGEWVYYEKRKK